MDEHTMDMTRRDREELGKVIRLRARVAKAGLITLAADRKADVERQLSAIYKADAKEWREITAEADRVVATAQAAVARICDERGIRQEFQPSLALHWCGRGENAVASRRGELRKLADARIDADLKAGCQCLEAWTAEKLTALLAGGLTSADAHHFLESLPSPEALLPAIRLTPELDSGITEPRHLLGMERGRG